MKDHGRENISVKSLSPEEKAAETTDQNLCFPSLCVLQGQEVEKMGVKLSPERREGWEEGALRI